LKGKTITVTCNQETEIGLPQTAKKAWLKQGSIRKELKTTKTEKGVSVTVPSVENGEIVLE